ncbi:hypothetical protein BDN72DRAFT_879402 [Pluteus cervinus]|uniref:Uncharacterized protein n=1 Tax=Pluteus cervinus TaxID=181527 RepID=A0ACD3AQA2_9AGAR|nr:hypothetical protein BDN72DRAFT_879402 [Pluteus cervinus]
MTTNDNAPRNESPDSLIQIDVNPPSAERANPGGRPDLRRIEIPTSPPPPIRVQPPSRASQTTNIGTSQAASPRRTGTNDTIGTRYMTPPGGPLKPSHPYGDPSPTVNGQTSALGGNLALNRYAASFLSPTIPTRPLHSPASTRVLDPWTQQFVESVNPYESHFIPWAQRPSTSPISSSNQYNTSQPNESVNDTKPVLGGPTTLPVTRFQRRQQGTWSTFLTTNVGQIFLLLYRWFLWNLPMSYYRRVVRVYEDDTVLDVFSSFSSSDSTSHPGWEKLVSSLVKEWKTLNLVSALLLSAIFSMFQLNTVSDDSLTRTFALLSLVCALMSLLYGCIYIIRFGSMKGPSEARAWFWELTKKREKIVRAWNGWTMLAMPAVWLSWSIVLFIISILCFLWRSRMDNPPQSPPFAFELGPQIIVSSILAVGVLYLILIFQSFSKFENHSDLEALAESPSTASLLNGFSVPDQPPSRTVKYPGFPTEKLIEDLVNDFRDIPRPDVYEQHDVSLTDWSSFIGQLSNIVHQGQVGLKVLTPFINRWNEGYLQPRGIQLVLCNESQSPAYSNSNGMSAHPMSPPPLSATSFVYESSWIYNLYSTSPPAGSEWRELRPVYQNDEIPIWLAPVQKPPDTIIFPLSGRSKVMGLVR